MILLTVCVLLTGGLYAQVPDFEHITAANGLSQGMVFDLLQDRRGFLWFATKDGLNRYDGYSFDIYQNDPFEPFSIAGNEIQALFEDHLGRIWAGTANNGAEVLDPRTGRFYHLHNLVNQNISSFAETPDGSVWIGTEGGVNRIKLPEMLPRDQASLMEKIRVDTFFWDKGQPGNRLPPNHTRDLATDRDGKLWMSTNWQTGWFDPVNNRFQTVYNDLAKLSKDGELFSCSLFADPDGSIWIGHVDQLLHIRAGKTDVFPLPERSLFPQIDMALDASGALFVSTRKQIFRLSAAAIQTPEQAHFDVFYRFPAEGIIGSTKMLVDRGGLLWIGTNGYGLRKYNPGDRHFRHIAPGISLRRIFCDALGRTWAWRSGGKFLRVSDADEQLAEPLLDDPDLLQHDCLADRNGNIWMLCENRTGKQGVGSLIKINPQTLRTVARFPVPGSVAILGQIKEGRDGKIRIIGNESILTSFDPASGMFESVDFSPATGLREVAYCLNEDSEGCFWIGTPHGLVRGMPGKDGIAFSAIKNNPRDRKSLNCDVVLSLRDDPRQPDRFLWIGTRGGGLNLLDKSTGECIHYTTAEGLPNNVVYAILPDSSGCLWLSTNCGLAKFDPPNKRFQNFYATDGLQDNEFNTVSYAEAADGQLFFGGVNGLTAFYPQALSSATNAPSVYLTALKIQNHTALPGDGVLDKRIEETSSVTLSYFQNQLSFEFAAMDFSAPKQNQYRYKLTGADRDWVEPTTANSATYANLAPGHYTFEVLSGGSHGSWNGTPARLEIDILPPWWRTNWAYLLYFLAITAALWSFYRFQINKIRLQNQLAFEHLEAGRLAELDRLKTNFFSSITHEFRTPLTLLLEPVRQLLLEVKDRTLRYRLELIEKNAHRLLRFVNQLLDLSKLEAGQMPLDLRPNSPTEVVRAVAETFLPLAAQHKIAVDLKFPDNVPILAFDRDKMEQIVSNLLSNALKFTGNGGRVGIGLTVDGGWLTVDGSPPSTVNRPPSTITLQVSDTGIGIPEDALPLVFNRFYQVGDAAAQGTGIGLALTKELVERMGGSISVDSRLGQGTIFTVAIPVPAGRETVDGGRETVDGERWTVDGKRWTVDGERWTVDGGRSTVDGVASTINPRPSTADHSPSTIDPPPSTVHRSPSTGNLLLLIEDDHELRQFLRASLPAEYRIAEAADGAEGIRMALELVPDLVVSDLMMPEKNGFEVCDSLKNDTRSSHIPVILLTAKSTVESKIEGLRHGADAYLTKPFRADELVAHIENLIASRRHLQGFFSKAIENQSLVESAGAVFEPLENEFLQKIIKVVEENLDNEAMDAESFARTVFMSRSQLHRKISALTGLPLTEFVRNYRLDRAREMLSRKEGSVSEIAWKTGFPNAKYFSTCFRERFGQSPSLYKSGAA